MSFLPCRLSVQNHPHYQQILGLKSASRESSLSGIHSRSRWRSAPTKSGSVPRLLRSWLFIMCTKRYGTEELSQKRRYQAAAKAREMERQTARRSISGPDFTPAASSLHRTNGSHAPTRPQRRGQGRGIGQPAAEVCAFGGC